MQVLFMRKDKKNGQENKYGPGSKCSLSPAKYMPAKAYFLPDNKSSFTAGHTNKKALQILFLQGFDQT
jgi:hypothetical protein